MSATLESQAEIIKLARQLGVEPDELAYLSGVPHPALAALREQVTETLFSGGAERFGLLAMASRLLPNPIAAMIARRALGPLLAAQLAGLVEPVRAAELARQLEPSFLADVAAYLDPRRAVAVITRIPGEIVAQVAAVLVERGDHITMGRFVAYLDLEVIGETFDSVPAAAMLQVAYVAEGKERLDELVSVLPPDRLDGVLVAARDADLWPETLSLIGYLKPETQARLADLAAGDDATLADLAAAAERHQTWDAILPIVPRMNAENRIRTAAVAAHLSDESLDRIIASVDAQNLWRHFVPLVAESMDAAGRERIADRISIETDAVINHFADAVEADNLWADLLRIADGLEGGQLQRIAERLLGTDIEARLPSLLDAVAANDLWPPGLALVADLPDGLKEQLAPTATRLDASRANAALTHARELKLAAALGPIGEALSRAAARA